MNFKNLDIFLLRGLFGWLDVLGLGCFSCLGGRISQVWVVIGVWVYWVWVVIDAWVGEYATFFFFLTVDVGYSSVLKRNYSNFFKKNLSIVAF